MGLGRTSPCGLWEAPRQRGQPLAAWAPGRRDRHGIGQGLTSPSCHILLKAGGGREQQTAYCSELCNLIQSLSPSSQLGRKQAPAWKAFTCCMARSLLLNKLSERKQSADCFFSGNQNKRDKVTGAPSCDAAEENTGPVSTRPSNPRRSKKTRWEEMQK